MAPGDEEHALLAASGLFDAAHYAAQTGLPEGTDLLRHYLEVGWRWQLEPRPGFESRFLQPYYEAAGLTGPPLLSWIELGARGGRLPSSEGEAQWRAGRIRPSPVFDAAWYARRLPEGLDPALHYVLVGEMMGWRPSPGFDPYFYNERYEDIPAIGLSPLLHYEDSGRREGRLPRAAADGMTFPRLRGAPGRRAVLVVAHEASRTGAPLLGWSVAKALRGRYDVVSVLLRHGVLEAAFAEVSAAVAGPMRWEEWHPAEMSRLAERLVQAYRPLYAIANSIETSLLVPALAALGVPSVALVHEFAAYTRPLRKLTDAFDWATDIVFPARVVAESSFKQFPHLARRRGVHVFPQGRVDPPKQIPASGAKPAPAPAVPIERAMRPPGAERAFVVLGAGSVEIRKGVDVFLSVAAAVRRIAPELDVRFAWVGGGYDPERDPHYSAYLAEQHARSGLEGVVQFLKPVADLDPVYAAADVFLMSSRLDPQPNVAIDALTRGLPVVCFAGASGTAEVLQADAGTAPLVAPHLDAEGAAEVIAGLARDPARHRAMRDAVRDLAGRVYDMAAYVDRVDGLGRAAAAAVRAEDIALVRDSGLLDADLLLPVGAMAPGLDGLAAIALQQWAAVGRSQDQAGNAHFRRAVAGFHPQAYAEAHGDEVGQPLAHWLRAGRPAGAWSHEVLPPLAAACASPLRVALHAHMHYPELAADLRQRLEANLTAFDLFVTTDTEAKAAALRDAFAGMGDAEVEVTPNRGRDIGPFLHVLRRTATRGYHAIGHLHAKRSTATDTAMGDRWRDFLWQNLAGPAPMLDTAAQAFFGRQEIGLVMAEDPHLVGWDENQALAESLRVRMGLRLPLERFFDFPLGTMFWARPAALSPLLRLELGWDDYPPEPLPYDGTVLHALERLIPFVVRDGGYQVAGVRVPGSTW